MSNDTSETAARGYDYRIECNPDFSFLLVRVPAKQTLRVEASGMATMDPGLNMKTRLKGGFGRMLTGESLFINEFTAGDKDGEIGIASACIGEMDHLYLDGETVYLQNSAFVASGPDVKAESKWQGFVKGFLDRKSVV